MIRFPTMRINNDSPVLRRPRQTSSSLEASFTMLSTDTEALMYGVIALACRIAMDAHRCLERICGWQRNVSRQFRSIPPVRRSRNSCSATNNALGFKYEPPIVTTRSTSFTYTDRRYNSNHVVIACNKEGRGFLARHSEFQSYYNEYRPIMSLDLCQGVLSAPRGIVSGHFRAEFQREFSSKLGTFLCLHTKKHSRTQTSTPPYQQQ